jgi:diguanylate cyclase (GGDEF)-like protein
MKLTKILIILVFLIPFTLVPVKYPVINYQTSDGLPQNQVNALIQDEMGYIFVGTQSGIGKFDGTGFEVITNKEGLSNNFIMDFTFDDSGNLWAATQGGLSRIDARGRITNYLPDAFILSLAYDSTAKTLWLVTRGGIFHSKGDSFEPYKELAPENSDFNSPRAVRAVAITASGDKYFYSNNHIVEVLAGQSPNRVFEISGTINIVKWLKPFKKLVIGTNSGLMTPADPTAPRLIPLVQLPDGAGGVTDAEADENLRLWISTENGLLSYSHLSAAPVVIGLENGLPTRRIRKLLIDREKNIIVGSRWGLSQISPNLIRMYDENDGLPSKFVWDFEEDNGIIYLGCDGGVVQLDPQSGQLTPFAFLNARMSAYSVRSIIKTGDKEFLLGTRRNGIFRWDGGRALEQLNASAGVFSGAKAADNTVWYGTDNGLLKYGGNRFKSFNDGVKDRIVYVVAYYDKDNLLVGTAKGLQTFHPRKEIFVSSEIENKIDVDTAVYDIRVVSNDEILVSTGVNGLFIYKNKRVRQVTTKNGMLHNDVWSAVKDDFGNIWFNTSVSVERYSDGFISHFNKQSGLFGDEGGVHSVFKSSFGHVYFGIVPGFIEIPPRHAEVNINKPFLFIKDVKVNGKSTHPPSEDSTKKNKKSLQLTHGQNSIELQYIAVSSRKENPVFYKTRLLPLETQWSAPTRETTIKYLKLPPDDYIFEVTANNGGGEDQWFPSRNKISFTIEKPFWLKWWFIFCLVVLGAMAVIYIHKIRVRSMERRQKHLEKLVEERTRELEYLSITDPLTDLKNRRYLEEKIKEDISLIERGIFARDDMEEDETKTSPILGVFILDIDYFKRVNDDYGHKAGDIVIVDIARLLIEMLRNSDTIVRWGGEEFLVITWQKKRAFSFELAERMRKRIEDFEFKIDENITIQKTVSVGFAHFPFIPNDIKTINWSHVVSLADSALYISKNNGRNMSTGLEFGGNKIKPGTDGKEIVSDIKNAIEKNYLKLVAYRKKLEISQHKT